jgi:hypothetical protein
MRGGRSRYGAKLADAVLSLSSTGVRDNYPQEGPRGGSEPAVSGADVPAVDNQIDFGLAAAASQCNDDAHSAGQSTNELSPTAPLEPEQQKPAAATPREECMPAAAEVGGNAQMSEDAVGTVASEAEPVAAADMMVIDGRDFGVETAASVSLVDQDEGSACGAATDVEMSEDADPTCAVEEEATAPCLAKDGGVEKNVVCEAELAGWETRDVDEDADEQASHPTDETGIAELGDAAEGEKECTEEEDVVPETDDEGLLGRVWRADANGGDSMDSVDLSSSAVDELEARDAVGVHFADGAAAAGDEPIEGAPGEHASELPAHASDASLAERLDDTPAPASDDVTDHSSASPAPASDDVADHSSASPAPASDDVADHSSASPAPASDDVTDHCSVAPAPASDDVADHCSVAPAPASDDVADHSSASPAPASDDVAGHSSASPAPALDDVADQSSVTSAPASDDVADHSSAPPATASDDAGDSLAIDSVTAVALALAQPIAYPTFEPQPTITASAGLDAADTTTVADATNATDSAMDVDVSADFETGGESASRGTKRKAEDEPDAVGTGDVHDSDDDRGVGEVAPGAGFTPVAMATSNVDSRVDETTRQNIIGPGLETPRCKRGMRN